MYIKYKMYNLPINRDNESWAKINYQFLKGGFDWYNQKIPGWRRWYYKYYLSGECEKYCCLKIAWYRRRNKVTCWLRNIEKFEKIKEKYDQENRENKEKEYRENKEKEDREKENKNEEKWWLRKWGDSNNSMSWRRTKYGQ